MKLTIKVQLSKQQTLEFLDMVVDLYKSYNELANYIPKEWNVFTHRFLANLYNKYEKKGQTVKNTQRKHISFPFTDEEAIVLSIIHQTGYVKHPYREAILRTIYGNTYKQLQESKPLQLMADTIGSFYNF